MQTRKLRAVKGFRYTTAIKKLRGLKNRLRIVPGGTSAGKTFGILPLLIDRAIKSPGLSVSVVSESIPHLKKGAIKDFKNIMLATKRWRDEAYNKTDRVYTFANGSYIEFFSADSEGRVRGPRRNVLYINECNNIAFDTYYQLAIRTDQEIWLDYNPSNEFWVHTELADDIDAEVLTLTYRDNEALAPSIVREIEKNRTKAFHDETLEGEALFAESNIKSSYWANWWKVYGLGKLGSLEGVIFSNWFIIKTVPLDAKLIGYGQDFGFTSDPAATVAVYGYDGKIIVDELLYKRGLINSELVKEYKRLGVKTNAPIWADKAEPKSIKEISGYGFRIGGADKGPDSVNFGIDLLQGYEILVTERSTNLIAELRSYIWERDKKTGQNTNAPKDANNHAIDALRYLAVMMLTSYQPNYKSKSIGKAKKKTRGEEYKDFL
jgi:phage terminase large subunit